MARKKSKEPGLPPGTLVHVGKARKDEVKVSVHVVDYDKQEFSEEDVEKVEELEKYKGSDTVTWINVVGVHDSEIIGKFGEVFDLHPLVLEDVMSTGQRPKVEEYDDYLYLVLRMFYYDDEKGEVASEQVSLILGEDYVISFQEEERDVLDPVRERLRNGKGRIRKHGADYLLYALADSIVDHYFLVIEKMGEKIEVLEEELVKDPDPTDLQDVHALKRDTIQLRKSVWPLREVISTIQRGGFKLISKDVEVYLRDLYDHTIQVIDTVETFRDMISGMLDIYMSSVSNKMNEVMQVLTVMATIFIPLTFIAGVYGMNFEYMPELSWRYGYHAVWGVMILVFLGMMVYFRKKDWL